MKRGSPYTDTSGAVAYSRMHTERASAMASLATWTGEHLVQIIPVAGRDKSLSMRQTGWQDWICIRLCHACMTAYLGKGVGCGPRTDVVLPLRFMQGNVLADEDTDANAAEVEAIQKLVDLWEFCQPVAFRPQLLFQLCHTNGHDWHHIPASMKRVSARNNYLCGTRSSHTLSWEAAG